MSLLINKRMGGGEKEGERGKGKERGRRARSRSEFFTSGKE